MNIKNTLNEIEKEIERKRREIKIVLGINKKANSYLRDKNFSMFSKEELWLISSMSGNQSITVNRELKEGIKDIEELLDKIRCEGKEDRKIE